MEQVHTVTRDAFPLSQKKIIKKSITQVFLLFITLLFAMPFLFSFLTKIHSTFGYLVVLGIGVLLLIIDFFIGIFYQWLYFLKYYYDLTENFVIIKKGVLANREITLPYEKIQDVYVDQDIWDRIFGLYDVHVASATLTSGFESHIDGVEKNSAEGLRNLILSKVKERLPVTQSAVAPKMNP